MRRENSTTGEIGEDLKRLRGLFPELTRAIDSIKELPLCTTCPYVEEMIEKVSDSETFASTGDQMLRLINSYKEMRNFGIVEEIYKRDKLKEILDSSLKNISLNPEAPLLPGGEICYIAASIAVEIGKIVTHPIQLGENKKPIGCIYLPKTGNYRCSHLEELLSHF